jgi:hypothetical protein
MSRPPAVPVLPAASDFSTVAGAKSRTSAFLPVTSWMLPTVHKQHKEVTAKTIADDLDCALITFRRLYGVSSVREVVPTGVLATSPQPTAALSVVTAKASLNSSSELSIAAVLGDATLDKAMRLSDAWTGKTGRTEIPSEPAPANPISQDSSATETSISENGSVPAKPSIEEDAAKVNSAPEANPENAIVVTEAASPPASAEIQPAVPDPLDNMSRGEALRTLAARLDASLHDFAHNLASVVSDPEVLTLLGRHIPSAAPGDAVTKTFADAHASTMPPGSIETTCDAECQTRETAAHTNAIQVQIPDSVAGDELDTLIRELQALAGIQKALVDEIHEEPAVRSQLPHHHAPPWAADTHLLHEVERSPIDVPRRADPLRQSAPASLLGELQRLRDLRKSWTFAMLHQRSRHQILQLMPNNHPAEAVSSAVGSAAQSIDPRTPQLETVTAAPSRAPRLELSLAPTSQRDTQTRLKEVFRRHQAVDVAATAEPLTQDKLGQNAQAEKQEVVLSMDEEKSAQSGFSKDSLLGDHAAAAAGVPDREPATESTSLQPPLVSSASTTAFIPLSAFLPTVAAPGKTGHYSSGVMQWPPQAESSSALSALHQPSFATTINHSFPVSSPIIPPNSFGVYPSLGLASAQSAAAVQPHQSSHLTANASSAAFPNIFAYAPANHAPFVGWPLMGSSLASDLPTANVRSPASAPVPVLAHSFTPSYTYAQLMQQHEEIAHKLHSSASAKWLAESSAPDVSSTRDPHSRIAAAAVSAQARARETLRKAAAVLTQSSQSRVPSPSASDIPDEDFSGDYVDLSGPRRR